MLKLLTKIGKLFKKASKAGSKSKDKGGGSAFDWPSGVRIGIYGHVNSGKTVYFTVLNEECKISRNLQISVTDNKTSAEFLSNRRSIWGLGTTSDVGTVVDLQSEKKFPEATSRDKVLQFNAILDGDHKVSVVTYDYPGRAVSITGADEIKDKVMDFMQGCDGLMFFYDPKIMGSELESQAHVSSFVGMVERLASQGKPLPIPVALVITKADVLPGFSGEDQVLLISPDDEHLLSEDFDLFLNKILVSSKVTADPTWTGTVRNVLIRLADFLKVVVGRTLNLQIFFISSTGQTPEKIGTDVGRSIYKPPAKITPVGVREPFYWLMHGVLRNRKITRLRSVAKAVTIACVAWAVLYSLPFLYHFVYLMPRTQQVEQEILNNNQGNVYAATDEERRKIQTAYSRYENSKLVTWLYQRFQAPSRRIRQFYRDFDISEAVIALDKLIVRFDAIVGDSTLWPKLNPSTDSLQVSPELEKVIADIGEYHTGDDESSVLFARSDRVLSYWGLLSQYIAGRHDTSFANRILEQVDFNAKTHGGELSEAEEKLGATFAAKLKVQAAVQEKKEIAAKASVEFDDVIAEINGNNSGAYRLGQAVDRLQRLKSQLNPATDAEGISAIDRYLQDARQWSRTQTFTYRIEVVPDNAHVHIEVTKGGEDATWSNSAAEGQLFQGHQGRIEWKMGDDIHIAFDEVKHKCDWGVHPSDKKVLKGRFALFDMEGDIKFENVGKQITISFKPELAESLPRLKK